MQNQINRRFGEFSDLEIESYLVGDLETERALRLEMAAAESIDLAGHIEARRREQRDFATLQPALDLPVPAARRRLVWPLALAGSAAAALVALWLVLLPPPTNPAQPDRTAPTIRARGALKANLVVRREGRIFTYRDGVLLRKGDQLRLTVESPQGGYLTLLGRDARGRITTYYDGLRAHAGTFTVPDSLVLDDSLEAEEWLVMLSERKLSVDQFTERLREDKALEAAAAIIHIAKEAAP